MANTPDHDALQVSLFSVGVIAYYLVHRRVPKESEAEAFIIEVMNNKEILQYITKLMFFVPQRPLHQLSTALLVSGDRLDANAIANIDKLINNLRSDSIIKSLKENWEKKSGETSGFTIPGFGTIKTDIIN